MRGWISEYSAQGMEGDFWRIFQDRQFCASREQDWRHEGMHILGVGHHLTILDPQSNVLWSGKIAIRRTGFLGWRKLHPNHPDWTPEGIPLETWESWFRHRPPLEAMLEDETTVP